jgi:Protein of unknown function (DUF3684)
MNIVPVPATMDPSERQNALHWCSPRQCYFGGRSTPNFYLKIFAYIDFGHHANIFLRACGVKDEPSAEDIAMRLTDDPQNFYEKGETVERQGHCRIVSNVLTMSFSFLNELRNIAVNERFVSRVTLNTMKGRPVLLGSQPKPDKAENDLDDLELQYALKRPDEIIIADDTNGLNRGFHTKWLC